MRSIYYYMECYAFISLFTVAFTFLQTFLAAYFYPGQFVTVYINALGEADIELVLLCTAAPCWLLLLIDLRLRIVPILRGKPSFKDVLQERE
jgi:hypothetical protein